MIETLIEQPGVFLIEHVAALRASNRKDRSCLWAARIGPFPCVVIFARSACWREGGSTGASAVIVLFTLKYTYI